ncbi:MAG: retroviral-like aspartic protease, partial [Sphingomonadales bacterium]|nr:retroviral-like aspartic protease [Sphingomonadales bacterium]
MAKMLVDSGNLVSDLISEEFAKAIGAKYDPVDRKVGTAAKGASVSIIGRCLPFKIFIENIAKAVEIQPFVVKELSHPLNVGRDFLGRHKGRLEFTPYQGFLEIGGQKTRLISKGDDLNSEDMTDGRIAKVLRMRPESETSIPKMTF